MAKQALVEAENPPFAGMVVSPDGPPLPDALKAKMASGRGVSHDSADNIVPLIYVLQALSPAVNRSKPEYLAGAEAGDFWLRNSSPPIVKGGDGFLFQPCFFYKDWVEWIPRTKGGGFQGRHDERPVEAKSVPDEKRQRWVMPSGNEVIETRYHAGHVMAPDGRMLPYLIPMSGSGHTVSRNFMFMLNQKTINGQTADSWAGLYRMKSISRTNAAGTWFSWAITDEGWIRNEDEYARGEALFNSFKSGEKQAEAPVEATEGSASDDGTM